MKKSAAICESVEHEGDPLVGTADLLDERIEYRSVGSVNRWATVTRQRICRTCARRDIDRMRHDLPDPNQESML